MGKIKNSSKKVKMKSKLQNSQNCPSTPSFSFVYLTKNKKYNFDYFTDKMKVELKEKQADLTKRLIEISQQTWQYWYNQSKFNGIETLDFTAIRFTPNNLELSPDEKIIVFRFSSGNCRMLGVKNQDCSSCATYYIIGFDFDYSAYNHGN